MKKVVNFLIPMAGILQCNIYLKNVVFFKTNQIIPLGFLSP